jgi:hypothetical protein
MEKHDPKIPIHLAWGDALISANSAFRFFLMTQKTMIPMTITNARTITTTVTAIWREPNWTVAPSPAVQRTFESLSPI